MSAFYVFAAVFCFLAGVSADSGSEGINDHKDCPNVKALSSLNVTRSLGRWYYIYATMNYTGEKCSKSFRIANKDEDTEFLYGVEYSKDGLDKPKYAKIKLLDPSQPGTYHFQPMDKEDKLEFDRSVLGNDYENYLVIYSCHTVGDKSIIDASILTRKRVSEGGLEEAFEVAAKNGLKREDFHFISAQSCPLE